MNSNSPASKSIMIRYKTAQLYLTIYNNIFEYESALLFLSHKKTKSNLSLHNIIIAQRLNITIQQDHMNRLTWIIMAEVYPLENYLEYIGALIYYIKLEPQVHTR